MSKFKVGDLVQVTKVGYNGRGHVQKIVENVVTVGESETAGWDFFEHELELVEEGPAKCGPVEVKREPVEFDYTALNWDFIRGMAWIPMHATEKYGSWHQYREARLVGEKSPINHAIEHLRKYLAGEPYDKRDGHIRWHLVAAAYNAMMEFYYLAKFGPLPHPLHDSRRSRPDR